MIKKTEIPNATMISRRERIFALLEEFEGWCSGEYISEQLGISRAAVAKHIAVLRSLGNGIESAPRKGYRLTVKTDCLSKESMEGLIAAKVFGKKEWHYLSETTSTNKVATLLAIDGAEEGCLVLAEAQAAGRGKKGSSWFTAPRGLQFSIILKPSIKDNITEVLTKLGTVAVAEAIIQLSPLLPIIKKPNDVLVNGRKVCGVLVEVGLLAGDTAWAVLGIGCNVNAQHSDFPKELLPLASSLLMENNTPISRRQLLAKILTQLEHWYGVIQQEELDALESRWQDLQKNA